jgi:hypothetical protein
MALRTILPFSTGLGSLLPNFSISENILSEKTKTVKLNFELRSKFDHSGIIDRKDGGVV